jgi:hypothetical protein
MVELKNMLIAIIRIPSIQKSNNSWTWEVHFRTAYVALCWFSGKGEVVPGSQPIGLGNILSRSSLVFSMLLNVGNYNHVSFDLQRIFRCFTKSLTGIVHVWNERDELLSIL